MKTKAHEDWVTALSPRLAQWGYDWEELARSCEQIVLFGSRAAGVSGDDSDFDLLCIGSGPSRLSHTLDVVFVKPEAKATEQWLGCELAGHIAQYGVWLAGEPDWVQRVHVSPRAIARKAEKISRRLQSVEQRSDLLDASYLHKYFVLTRRDLQRHECLVKGEPVPPTPLLDQTWGEVADPQMYLHRLARAARVESRFLLERLCVSARWYEGRKQRSKET